MVFFIIKGQVIVNIRHDLFVCKEISVLIDVRIIVFAEVLVEMGVVIVLWNLFNCLKSVLLPRISRVLAMRAIDWVTSSTSLMFKLPRVKSNLALWRSSRPRFFGPKEISVLCVVSFRPFFSSVLCCLVAGCGRQRHCPLRICLAERVWHVRRTKAAPPRLLPLGCSTRSKALQNRWRENLRSREGHRLRLFSLAWRTRCELTRSQRALGHSAQEPGTVQVSRSCYARLVNHPFLIWHH